MTKKELVQHLLDGNKMTSDDFMHPDEAYCVFDENYGSPFRYVNKNRNEPIEDLWEYTNWREVKEKDYGWRIPTIQELLTLVNYKKSDPACDLEDTKSVRYWTSSLYDEMDDVVWEVFFGYGHTYYAKKSETDNHVRCIREKKDGSLEWSKSSKEKMNYDEAVTYSKTLTDDDVYSE